MDHIDEKLAAWLIINHANWPLSVKAQALTDVSGRTYAYHIIYAHQGNTAITTILPDGLKWLENHRMIRAS